MAGAAADAVSVSGGTVQEDVGLDNATGAVTGRPTVVDYPAPFNAAATPPSAESRFAGGTDHGAPNLVAFPSGGYLYADKLSAALQEMQSKQMFNQLTFYIEACESGSMFPDLTSTGKIYGVTASNAT